MLAGLHHIAISARSIDESSRFYRDHFGLRVVMEWEMVDGRGVDADERGAEPGRVIDEMTGLTGSTGRQTFLRAPNAHIELFEWTKPSPARRPADWRLFDHGITHVCFQVDDVARWQSTLGDAGVRFMSEPQVFGPVTTTYALDPDDNIIELLEPHPAGARLELPHIPAAIGPGEVEGIHHVGISAIDLDAAERFYAAAFGLAPLGDRIDFSDGRFDDIWQTTGSAGQALFLPVGNGFIELFGFTSPAPRPRDANWRVCDHGFTHFSFELDDLPTSYPQLVTSGMRFNCPPKHLGGVWANYGQDVDGNVIELIQPLEPGRHLSIRQDPIA